MTSGLSEMNIISVHFCTLYDIFRYCHTDSDRQSPEQTDQMIQGLSECISSNVELRALAINGLGLDAEKVQKHLENYPKAITAAAFDLLMEWRNSQNNRQSAYKELYKGLKNSNLELYIAMVLKPRDKKPSKSSSSKTVKGENSKAVKRLTGGKRKR